MMSVEENVEDKYLESLKNKLRVDISKIYKQRELGSVTDVRFQRKLCEYLDEYTKEVREVSLKTRGKV